MFLTVLFLKKTYLYCEFSFVWVETSTGKQPQQAMHSATKTKTTRMMGVPQDGVHSRGSFPTKRDVLEFFHECRECYLVMPHLETETATAKPWRTLKAAHVAWIHEKEKASRVV